MTMISWEILLYYSFQPSLFAADTMASKIGVWIPASTGGAGRRASGPPSSGTFPQNMGYLYTNYYVGGN